MHDQLGPGLADAEVDLALAVDVNDRVLDRPQPAERETQQHGLDAGRQNPCDRGALADTHGLQPGRHPLSPILELGEGQGAIGLVDQHHPVAGGRHPLLEQIPEGQRIKDGGAHDPERTALRAGARQLQLAAQTQPSGARQSPTRRSPPAATGGLRTVPGGGDCGSGSVESCSSDPGPVEQVTPSSRVCHIFVTIFFRIFLDP